MLTWSVYDPLSPSDRLMGVLRPVVQALMRTMLGRRHDLAFCSSVGSEPIGDHRAWRTALPLITGVVDVPPSSGARAAFAALGLERFGPPLLLSGAFLLDRQPVPPSLPYLGIPPTAMMRIDFDKPPAYALTIENFASFNRHVLEADPDRVGLTLFVGGYPSLATQRALAELGSLLPESVPFFHWSDIDPDGTWIFRTIERALGRPLRPHLMSRELAEKFGEASAGISKLRRSETSQSLSLMSDLVNYFTEPGSKVMEQEQIDPKIPEWPITD